VKPPRRRSTLAVDGVIWHLAHFLNTAPPPLAFFALTALVAPPAILWHELGHAAVARRRIDGFVGVDVGAGRVRLAFELYGVRFRIAPVWTPFGLGGVCRWDATHATAADAALIALAGPAASLVGATLSIVALGHTTPGTPAHAVLWTLTNIQCFSTALCLVPFSYRRRRGDRPISSDGKTALDALSRLGGRVPRG
jgi:hypothetical protein